MEIPFLEKTALQFPEHPAVLTGEQTITYRQFCEQVRAARSRLEQAGIHRGEWVGVLSENRPEYLVLVAALWYMGAVAVPVSSRWPVGMIRERLREIGVRRLIFSREIGFDAGSGGLMMIPLDRVARTDRESVSPPLRDADLKPEQDASIIFTSGSTGGNRGVLHTLANHYFSALGSNQNIVLKPGDVWLISLPLYHVGGLAIWVRAVLAGAAVAISTGKWEVPGILRNFPVTHLSLVATQLHQWLGKMPVADPTGRLKAVLLGGGAIPFPLVREARQRGLPLFTSYGSTEMASQITTTAPGDSAERLKTAGKPLPFRELFISKTGEILLRGKTLARGYVGRTGIQSCLSEDGWYHSRDRGKLDSRGYLRVTGRLDNMFISGGENIQPEEIEKQLEEYPGIKRALVVPVADSLFGERPVAFLKSAGEGGADNALLTQFLLARLPRFQVPDFFFPWDEALDGNGMKIDRRAAARLAEKLVAAKRDGSGG